MTDRWYMHRRAQDSVAQSYLTNSKRPESLVKGVYPTHVRKGQGCYLFDERGNRYLDFICGLGTNLLGYGNERIASAIASELRNGYSHSLATHHEVEAAEKLKECFPYADCWKFLKSGSEACSAAVRIARAVTGRDIVFSSGYHGWHDGFVSLTEPALGVPNVCLYDHSYDAIWKFDERYSEESFRKWNPAAVIIEPVITDWSEERVKWLHKLRADCTKYGVLLIFDEVITGFRFPKMGVSNYFGVTPDLVVLGKAIAGGMPLAAVGGKYSVMNGAEYFVSSSYAGETLSLVAAKATIEMLQTKWDLGWLWERGKAFQESFNAIWEGVQIEGYPTRGILKAEPLVKALFMQEACKAGMLFGPSFFYSFPLAEEAPNALGAIKSIMTRIRNGEVKLEGEMPKSPFAQKVREAK